MVLLKSFLFCCLLIIGLFSKPVKISTYKKFKSEDTVKINRLLQQSASYQQKAPDQGIQFARTALLLSQQSGYSFGQAQALNQLSLLNEKYNHIDQAIQYEKEALTLFNSLHNNTAAAAANLRLGLQEGKRKNFSPAIIYVNAALAIYQKLSSPDMVIKCYQKLGEIYDMSGNTNQALNYYLSAQKLQQGKAVSEDYFNTLKSLGKLYSKSGDHQKALIYFEEGINQSDTQPFNQTHIRFLRKAGNLHDSLGNKSEALTYHKQALTKARQYHLPNEEAKALIGIAKIIKNQDAGQSLTHLNKALGIAQIINNKQLAAEIYHSLSDIYRQQTRFKDALFALEEHHQLLDSLLNINKQHEVNIMKGNYELEASRAHVQSLKLNNERRTYERNAGILVALIVVIILFAFWYYLYKTRKLNTKLAESNQVKDQLFSIIGHDLRNPIGGITQMLAILEEEPLNEEQQEMVTIMRKQGEVAGEILNSLLDWGKTQLKGVELKQINFRTKNIITKNIELLANQAKDKAIVIKDVTLSEIQIFGDADHFDFIIRNLLSNAIKFSFREGQIEIYADNKKESGKIIFSVTDHGKGISEEQVKKFNNSNLDVSYGTQGEKGTGIGLTLSKEFIKANGGRIWVENTPGQGATFSFSFHHSNSAPV